MKTIFCASSAISIGIVFFKYRHQIRYFLPTVKAKPVSFTIANMTEHIIRTKRTNSRNIHNYFELARSVLLNIEVLVIFVKITKTFSL